VGPPPQDWRSSRTPPFPTPTRGKYRRLERPHRPRGRNTSLTSHPPPDGPAAPIGRALRDPGRALHLRQEVSPEPEPENRLQNRVLLPDALEHAFAGMCSKRGAAAKKRQALFFPANRPKSRRPDSNRGPLHYELSASNSGIARFPCKCQSRWRSPSPWKSAEVHSAPAMCSNGVPIAAIQDAAVSKTVIPR
jgi:hypothetical protein